MGYEFDLRPLLILPFLFCGIIWGGYETIDYFFLDEEIRSEKIIKPKIELEINNNKVDTIYVYTKQD